MATAERLAEAVSLDMISHWAPTVGTSLGRITCRVREAVRNEAADRMADMKKLDMAEAAGQLLVGTTRPPALLRTPPAGQGSAEHQQAESAAE